MNRFEYAVEDQDNDDNNNDDDNDGEDDDDAADDNKRQRQHIQNGLEASLKCSHLVCYCIFSLRFEYFS